MSVGDILGGLRRRREGLIALAVAGGVLALAVVLSGPTERSDEPVAASPTATPSPAAEASPAPGATATPTATVTPTATRPVTPTPIPTPPPPPPPVAVTPDGEEVPRLSLVRIAFLEPPPDTEVAELVSIEPAVEGSFVWVDERTLLFQPEFPGWDRGGSYRVRVDGAASGLDEDHEHAFTVEGQLEVTYFTPADGDRDVPSNAQILVQFNRSVAALTVLQEGPGPPVLEFDPPLAGHGEWLNTSLYRFIPTDLRPSTEYRVRIPAGLTSATDGTLEEEVAWRFTTILPVVNSISPHDNSEFVEQDRGVVIAFNQPMDRASVEAGIVFQVRGWRPPTWPDNFPALGAFAAQDDPNVASTFSWNDRSTVVTLTPLNPLRRSTSYSVIVPAGLLAAGGAEMPVERAVTFTTLDWPRLLRTSPRDGEQGARPWWNVRLHYNNPMDAGSFDDQIAVSGIDPDDVAVWVYYDEATIDVPLEYSTEYTVTVGDGIRDRGQAPLPPHEFSFTTRDPDPPRLPGRSISLSTPGQFATFSASTEQELFFKAVNAPSVRFRLHPLTDAEARKLLERRYIDTWRYNPRRWVPFIPSQSHLRDWSIETTRDEVQRYTSRRYSTLLGDGSALPKGDYVLFADSDRGSDRQALMFSVVDTAIITKQSHNELLTWVVDYDTGQPLDGLTVETFATPYTLSHTGSALTREGGLAQHNVSNQRWGQYLVRLDDGGRFGVTTTWWQRGSEPWQLDVPFTRNTFDLLGHLYTDRPIYRTGETVAYKATVRVDDDATYMLPPPEETFTIRVIDARYKELLTTTTQLNEFGTIEGEFVIPEGAATGTYYIELAGSEGSRYLDYPVGREAGRITASSFTVQEFRVPEYRVAVEALRDHYIDGEQIAVEATAEFFFGGAVEGAAVNWAALASPAAVYVEGYGGYSFSNYSYYYWDYSYRNDQPLRATGIAETADRGVASFDVPAVLSPGEGTRQFTISATVRDESAQAVAASTSVTVHPAAYYAGIRTDSYIAREGEPETVRLVTADIEGNVTPWRPVTVYAYSREWVTTKVDDPSGGRRYQTDLIETEVASWSITTSASAEASLAFTPPSSGSYRLIAESVDGQGRVAKSSAYLWVSGHRYAPWRMRNDDSIDLIADADGYEVGDVAEILVPAPFAGATALVTIERGSVLSHEVHHFETNSEVLRIPIRDKHLPNIYVSVVLYRPPTDDDTVPRYHIGYIELPVSTAPRHLDVRIEPDRERAAPGETVSYEVTVTDWLGRGVEGDVSVAIVDEAVLSLADEVGPDGLRAFWFQRALGVATGSSLATSIDRVNDVINVPEEADGKGGGDSGIRLRTDFRNTALWIGQLQTDADGKASFELQLPDNATTWRAQARAVSGTTQVGEGASELLVTQPLVVRPALPRFLRVGDEVTLRTLVHNGTTSARSVTVAVETNGIDLDASTLRTARIESDRSVVFEWPARATAEGEATVRFRAVAAGGDIGDAVEISLPVHLNATAETTATGGVIEGALAVEAVYLPDYAIQKYGELEISVQGALVGALTDELGAFAPRRYEWSERIASRVIATVAARRAEGQLDERPLPGRLTADVAKLLSIQRGDGGWAWCSSYYCDTNVWITAWVLIALAEAQDAGAVVPSDVTEDASRLISRHVHRRTDVVSPADPNQHAFLLHALTRAAPPGSSVTRQHAATMRALVEQDRSRLTNWGRAYTLLGLISTGHNVRQASVRALLNDITADIVASANGNHWEDEAHRGSMHNSSVRTTALVLRALADVDPRHPLIEETVRWLVHARSLNKWNTTVARAQAMSSLGAYAQLTGERLGDYDYAVWVNTDEVLDGHFNVSAGEYSAATEILLTELPLGEVSRVQFERDASGPGRMYYGLNLRYVTPALGISALNRGFAVSHRYTLLDDPDEPVTAAKLGEVVRVELTVIAPHDRLFVLVEDFLPAGLEPINPRLNIVSPDLIRQLEEDRVSASHGAAPGYYAPWYGWYYSPWQYVDIRDDRVELHASRLYRGVHQYIYYARATTPGEFIVPPARAEESYFPEVFGRSDSGFFTVTDE
ncbi:MAG: Ig-like domain-containing protein [Chloroflexi bacterium]|nr:Ig-like domain-containing protein [Chloroflexota bacterium]